LRDSSHLHRRGRFRFFGRRLFGAGAGEDQSSRAKQN
jgi:hypothetical protein